MPSYFKRTNKYGAKRSLYGGNVYHSQAEANYAAFLDACKTAANPADRVVRWERQVKVSFDIDGKHICNWFPDFHVWYADGMDRWIEVKGRETEAFLIKRNLFRAMFPDRILEIVKV